MPWFRRRWSPRAFVLVWTVVVIVAWNLVFDRVIVLAGRAYIGAATVADQATGQQLLISNWVPGAVQRAIYDATAVSGAVMLVGLAIFNWYERRAAPPPS